MQKMKAPTYCVPLLFSIFPLVALVATPSLYAQAPAAGTRVVVKMTDTVDSASDPAGKQYHATVTAGVDAGNGVMIERGSAATIALKSSGSNYTAQLSSVTINGQVVAVTSNSASVSGLAQNVQAKASGLANSVLGGFGHHVNAPASAAAAASGQHVSIPIGTSLTFTLGQPAGSTPGGSTSASTPASAAPAPAAASAPTAAAAPSPTGAPPPGRNAFLCRYYGQKDGHPIAYITPVVYEDTLGQGHLSDRFYSFMKTNYDISKVQQGAGQCRRVFNDAAGQANTIDQLEKQWAASKTEVTHLTWTDSPTEAAAANAATASAAAAAQYAAAHPAAPFISCSTRGTPGVDIYVTGIFQTTKPVRHSPSGAKTVDQSILDNFHAYLTQNGYKFTPGSAGGCDVSPTLDAAQTAQHTRIHGGGGGCGYCGFKTIETGWKE